jgi:hypothetical protein
MKLSSVILWNFFPVNFESSMTIRLTMFCLGCVLLLAVMPSAFAQQVPDLHFNSRVEAPAYKKDYPRVMFDEAHNNSFTAAGGYKPFADLIFSDGYQLIVNRKPFAKEQLRTFKILVIVNGLGAEESDDEGAERPAFTEEEVNVVIEWVRGGGSLLLISDNGPFAAASEVLAKRLAVDMGKGLTTDKPQADEKNDTAALVFSRENKLIVDHPITRGRSDDERVRRIVTFAGQSLKGPEASESFLKLSATAVDGPLAAGGKESPAADRAQGIAVRVGKGRVVVLGDAGMLTAQVDGLDQRPLGMNVPNTDNRQLTLNIMHWLSGILK